MVLQRPHTLIYHTTLWHRQRQTLRPGLHRFGGLTPRLSSIYTRHFPPESRKHGYANVCSILKLAPHPPCVYRSEKWAYAKLLVLVISKLASLRDLERARFICMKKCLHSARTSKRRCSCFSHPQGGSRVFVGESQRGGEAAGATPLCKQLTPVGTRGRGLVKSPCSPGMVPPGPGRKVVDRLKTQCGDQTRTFGLHLSLPPRQRQGRWGEPETGGPTPHQLARLPASAHSHGNFSSSLSSLLRQPPLPFLSLTPPPPQSDTLYFTESGANPDQRFYSAACFTTAGVFALNVFHLMAKSMRAKRKLECLQRDVNKRQIRKRILCLEQLRCEQ